MRYQQQSARERERERARQTKALSPVVLLLLRELWVQLERLPVKPKATIALLAANIGLYLSPWSDAYSRQQHCLCASKMLMPTRPYSTLADLPFNRLLLSGFLHADDWHLYYNCTSLLWKGSQLEPAVGTERFVKLVVFSLVVSHALYLVIASALVVLFDYSESYHSCAVGFSAVLFSLKYVLNSASPQMTQIHGFAVPLKHACWAELVIASLVSPNVSFVGHLAGILAGLIYVHAKLERAL